MQLKISIEEIEEIIIEWDRKINPQFNTVNWDGYSSPRSATFSYLKEKDADITEAEKAK